MSLVGSKLFLYNGKKQKNVKKMGQFQENISCKLQGGFPSNILGRVVYMEDKTYVNLIEICLVVIEIRIEKGELVIPVNNTVVSIMAFLATDTQLCVLIL